MNTTMRSECRNQNQLALVDIAEKGFKISPVEAINQRINLHNQEMTNLTEQLHQLDGLKDREHDRLEILKKIADVQATVLDETQKQAELSNDFIAGLQEGLRRYLHDAQTAFQGGLQVVQDVTSGMKSAFTSFFDYTSNKFLDFKNLALDILKQIYDALVQALIIAPLLKGITGALGNLLGVGEQTFMDMALAEHQGGLIMHSGGYVPRFHPGGLAYDEIPAILQKGEYVVSRRGVETLDRINRGDVGPASRSEIHYHINIQAVDPQSFADLVRRNPSAILSPVLESVKSNGPMRNAIRRA